MTTIAIIIINITLKTPKQLKNELQTCIVSSSHEYWLGNVFPFILDKMTAVQVELKIECLEIIDHIHYQLLPEHFFDNIADYDIPKPEPNVQALA